jgi:hypothetical protein
LELTKENEELSRGKLDLEQIVKNILFEKELKKYQSQSGSSTAHSVSSFKTDSLFESHTPSKLQSRSTKSNLLNKKQAYRTFRDEPTSSSFELKKGSSQQLNSTPFNPNKGGQKQQNNSVSISFDKENQLNKLSKCSMSKGKKNTVLNEVVNVQQLLQAQNPQTLWQLEIGSRPSVKNTTVTGRDSRANSMRTSSQRSSLNTSVPDIRTNSREQSVGSCGDGRRFPSKKRKK